jgi:hypothetical protein
VPSIKLLKALKETSGNGPGSENAKATGSFAKTKRILIISGSLIRHSSIAITALNASPITRLAHKLQIPYN